MHCSGVYRKFSPSLQLPIDITSISAHAWLCSFGEKNQTLNMLWLTTPENLFYLFLHNNFFSSQDKWGSWRLGKEIWKSADLKTEKTKASADQGETLTLQKSKCGHQLIRPPTLQAPIFSCQVYIQYVCLLWLISHTDLCCQYWPAMEDADVIPVYFVSF